MTKENRLGLPDPELLQMYRLVDDSVCHIGEQVLNRGKAQWAGQLTLPGDLGVVDVWLSPVKNPMEE